MMETATNPVISVIIPVRNEVRFIDRCLESIFAADPVPGGIEVIVVDGVSKDGTQHILDDWARRQPNLRILNNPPGIVPTGMNVGIRAARGEWVVRVDAHSEYPRDYLMRCLETSRRTGMDNVGGVVVTMPGDGGRQARLVQAVTTHAFGVGDSGFRIGAAAGRADTVPYGCYRREVFSRIGLYDERLVRNQDYELNARLRKAGGSIWRDPAMRIIYYNQRTLGGLFRQALVTGQWNPWMWYVAPYSFRWRHAVPAVFVAALLGALLLACLAPVLGQLAVGGVLTPYLSMALAASVQQSKRYGGWMFPLLPVVFCSYHVAYGLGALLGICMLVMRLAPVQHLSEPWPGAGAYRAWPLQANADR
jgi:glycosyltransferase involved in cell wall biosynthesis